MKILLLEDDVALNRAIKKITQLDKHITISYLDGQDVFDDLDATYDLYILDINVPNINGLELLQLIQRQNNASKVIIISSNTDIVSLKKAYKYGCIDYIKKPFHLEELHIKIEKLNTQNEDLFSTIKLKNDVDNFTKKEKDFLTLLLNNQNSTVSYEMIDESLYKDKSMSMDGLRAMVRRVRVKLADDIIHNVVDEGYKILDL